MPFWLPAAITAAGAFASSALGSSASKANANAAIADSAAARSHADLRYEAEQERMLGGADYRRSLSVGYDQIGRERDLAQTAANTRQAFALGAEQGLTPQEIAGSPVPGGMVSSSGNQTLGNNMAAISSARAASQDRAADRALTASIEASRNRTELMKTAMQTGATSLGSAVQARGQDVQMSSAQLQAETQKQVAQLASQTNIITSKISADAQVAASSMIAAATKYSADSQRLNVLGQLRLTQSMNDAQIAKMAAETAVVLQDKDIKEALHSERWAKLFSGMSSENVVTSALAVRYGLDLEKVLTGVGVTPEMLEALGAFNEEVLSRSSYINRETEAVTGIIQDGWNSLLGRE